MANPNVFTLSELSAEGIEKYLQAAWTFSTAKIDIREYLTRMDLYFQREVALAEQITQNGECKPGKQDEFIVPVILPQVLSARAFLTNVFASPEPIFQAVAEPDKEEAAKQITAVICDQAARMAWKRNLSLTLLDGLKYNLMAVEADWVRLTSYAPDTPKAVGQGASLRTVNWEGNSIKRMDLYNTFWDGRVNPAQMHELGEYAGYVECMGRTRFKKFVDELPADGKRIETIKKAVDSQPLGSAGSMTKYVEPVLRADAMAQQDTSIQDWTAWWAGTPNARTRRAAYPNVFEVVTFYARIVPADFYMNVPTPKTPQIFKFVVVNSVHVIYYERQTNAHDWLPILFGQPMEDGLGYQTKSFEENLLPMQEMASKLWSAEIASTRRIITDRALYDPSRIPSKLINSPNSNAKIPVRPAAYNTPIEQGYHQIPYEDRALGLRLQQATAIMGLSNVVSGQNPVKQGQFVKGNKTDQQFQESMAASDARMLDMAILLEDQFFYPLKYIIKSNILQYQPPANIFNKEAKQAVEIDPAMLRKASWDFQMADGLIPPERLANSEDLAAAVQVIGQSEQLQQEYDAVAATAYLFDLQNIKGMSKFRRTAEQKQQMAQERMQQEAGAQAALQKQAEEAAMRQAQIETEAELRIAQEQGDQARILSAQEALQQLKLQREAQEASLYETMLKLAVERIKAKAAVTAANKKPAAAPAAKK